MAMGFEPDAFWDQTVRTITLAFQATTQRLEREHNERMSLAWHVAALSRTKKLPKLQTMLARSTVKRAPQSWQQQLEIAKMWTAVLGGKFVSKDKAN